MTRTSVNNIADMYTNSVFFLKFRLTCLTMIWQFSDVCYILLKKGVIIESRSCLLLALIHVKSVIFVNLKCLNIVVIRIVVIITN